MTKEEILLDIAERCGIKIDDNEDVMEFDRDKMAEFKKWLFENLKNANQVPCEDTVNRTELKKWLDMNFSFGGAARKLEFFDRLDKELPPVTSTQRWIPVSERLPEPNTAVLIYVNTGASETFCLAYWNDACYGWEEWTGIRRIETEMEYTVLAWMPLPEPYKAE